MSLTAQATERAAAYAACLASCDPSARASHRRIATGTLVKLGIPPGSAQAVEFLTACGFTAEEIAA